MSTVLYLLSLFAVVIFIINLLIAIGIFLFQIPSIHSLTLSPIQDAEFFIKKHYLFEKLHNELINSEFELLQVLCIQNKSPIYFLIYKNPDKTVYCNLFVKNNALPYTYEFIHIDNHKQLLDLCVSDMPLKFLHSHREFYQIAFSSKYTFTQLYQAFLAKIKNLSPQALNADFKESEQLEIIRYFWEKDIQAYIRHNIIEPESPNNFHKLTRHGKIQYFLKLAYPFNSLYIHKVSKEAKAFFNLK